MGHRCQYAGRRRDADAGAVVDDDQRQETLESAVSTALPTARPSVGATNRSAKRSAWFCMRVSPIGAAVDKLGDLAGGGVGADAGGADGDLAFAQHGRGEDHLATARGNGQAFAGDGLLVDHRGAVDHVTVDRDNLAGIDHDQVAADEFDRGHGEHRAVAQHPGGSALEIPSAPRSRVSIRAAVRSRIQSPRRISQVMMPPVTCRPWAMEAAMASVSRKSTFSRRFAPP